MDTGSHLLFGFTLAGLSYYFPPVQHDPALAAAVLTVTMIGSNAPDFDAALKLFGKELYLRNHRGLSHSLPAWFVWAGAIGALGALAWGQWTHLPLLCGFALLAVLLHVGVDYLNGYGVQLLRPFNQRWYHLDSLCLTDPFLIALHMGAAAAVITGLWPSPADAAALAWSVTALYAVWRTMHHQLIVRRLRRRYRRWKAIHVLPGLWWFRWQYAVQTDDGYELGTMDGRRQLPYTHIPTVVTEHACIEKSRTVSAVRTLLAFAKRQHVSWTKQADGGYLVTWTDVRFWREKDWPYRAEVRMDGQYNVIHEQVGWHKKAWQAPYV